MAATRVHRLNGRGARRAVWSLAVDGPVSPAPGSPIDDTEATMPTPDDDPTGFEVDRHVDEQPPREDLLDPDEIAVEADEEIDELLEADDPELGDPARLPDDEDLPESQGADVVEAERLAEDHAERPGLHDEPE